jgi:hypothetical protein
MASLSVAPTRESYGEPPLTAPNIEVASGPRRREQRQILLDPAPVLPRVVILIRVTRHVVPACRPDDATAVDLQIQIRIE